MSTTISLGLVGLLLLTMPVYAVFSRGRPIDPEVARRPKTILLGHWVRDWLMWVIGPMERGFVRAGPSPDFFNFLGAALGLGAGVAFASGDFAIAGWLVLLGGAADIFDSGVLELRTGAAPGPNAADAGTLLAAGYDALALLELMVHELDQKRVARRQVAV